MMKASLKGSVCVLCLYTDPRNGRYKELLYRVSMKGSVGQRGFNQSMPFKPRPHGVFVWGRAKRLPFGLSPESDVWVTICTFI